MARTVQITKGTTVRSNGVIYEVVHILDPDSVLGRCIASSDLAILHIADLELASESDIEATRVSDQPPFHAVSEAEWEKAKARYLAIKDVLDGRSRTKKAMAQAAESAGVHMSTLYRWLRQYDTSRTVRSLATSAPSGGRGKSRLSDEVETLIQDAIAKFYLTRQRRSVQYICNEVARRCKNAGLTPPHANTVRNRIASLSERETLAKRRGRKALERFQPNRGSFPGADYPLAVVQIDHTKIDLILVSDTERQPIGRPWITLGIDVYSRMVTGFFVGFEPPGTLPAGICIANSILPKDRHLKDAEITTAWPVWGVMKTLHLDNAKEFRGNSLRMSCENYDIDIQWRPVARPNYGGHIERLLGTFNTEIHALPGTTFSDIASRGDYPSTAKATLSLKEFERWLTYYIVEVYHQRIHSGLGMTPAAKYEQGIFGDADSKGVGLRPKVTDEATLRLDFLPTFERTIQPYGILLDGISYYADVLRPWIGAKSTKDKKLKRAFMIKRDPRDISVVYFYDPGLQAYYEVPYRDMSRPPMTLWELRQAKAELKKRGEASQADEADIFAAYERMREIEKAAKSRTLKARRSKERKRVGKRVTATDRWTMGVSKDFKPELDVVAPFDELDDGDG